MCASTAMRLAAEAVSPPMSRTQDRERTPVTAVAPPRNASLISAAQITKKPARASSGQCTKLRRHQGSAARRSSSRITRDSSVGGARRKGSTCNVRSNRRSIASSDSFVVISLLRAIGGDAARLQDGQQRRPGAAYVGFDLGKRGTELDGDLLVGEVLEVIQHQCQPLMLGEFAQRAVDQLASLLRTEICEQHVRLRPQIRSRRFLIAVRRSHLREQPPPPAIPLLKIHCPLRLHRPPPTP